MSNIVLQSNINNLHEKICASNWLKTSAFSCNMGAKLKYECKLQIAQAHFQNLAFLDFW